MSNFNWMTIAVLFFLKKSQAVKYRYYNTKGYNYKQKNNKLKVLSNEIQ
jgi:hypothetical protein